MHALEKIKGSFKTEVTATERGGQGFCDDSAKALEYYIKSVTMGEEGSKYVQNCVTSFMDDP